MSSLSELGANSFKSLGEFPRERSHPLWAFFCWEIVSLSSLCPLKLFLFSLLTKFNVSNFFFVTCAFGVVSKKSLPTQGKGDLCSLLRALKLEFCHVPL